MKKSTSLQKGLEIMNAYVLSEHGVSVKTLSDRMGMPLSTLYRYIETLVTQGFLSKNPNTKNFEPGPVLIRMGYKVYSKFQINRNIRPYMKALQEQSGETIVLHVRSGFEALCIERIESQGAHTIRFGTLVGETLPLHAGASAKILLAYQPNSFVNIYLRDRKLNHFTNHTITDPELIKKELDLIREKGLAYSDGEVNTGAGAIAAPIFFHEDEIAASIAIVGPKKISLKRTLCKLTRILKDTAKAASRDLGYND